MAVTPEQLAAMEAAYFSGEKSITHNGRTVTYHDLPSLWQAIQNARAEIAEPDGGRIRVRRVRFVTNRGY